MEFAKLSLLVELQSVRGGIVSKRSEYRPFADASEILGVSLGTVRTWAADGMNSMHRNPANGYRLFTKADLRKFFDNIAYPVPHNSR